MLTVRVVLRRGSFRLEAAFRATAGAVTILGRSGAGKTSILLTIAGHLRPDDGEIRLGDEVLYSSARGIDLPAERRRVGWVPQEGHLFPHLTVDGNLRYGWRRRAPADRRIAPERIVELLELGALLDRRPAGLSGGERQRVALGRALLASPSLLLMDEPLASLDRGLRRKILPYLVAVRDELGIPLVYVTHVVSEALEIAEEVVIVDGGRVVAEGRFHDVLVDPVVFDVARSLGLENVIPARVVGRDDEGGTLVVEAGEARLKAPPADLAPGRRVFLTVGADEVLLSLAAPEGLSARNALPATVASLVAVGDLVLIRLDAGFPLFVEVTPEAVGELGLIVGKRLHAVVKTHSLRLVPR